MRTLSSMKVQRIWRGELIKKTRITSITIDVILVLLKRNRRESATLSPVLIHFVPPDGKLYLKLQRSLNTVEISPNEPLTVSTPRRPGPKALRRSIPLEDWPVVVRRIVENQEPLRKVAGDYEVSYETVRHVVHKAQRQNRE